MELIQIDYSQCKNIHGRYYWYLDNEEIGFASSIVYETKEQAILAVLTENIIWETMDLHDRKMQSFIERRECDR